MINQRRAPTIKDRADIAEQAPGGINRFTTTTGRACRGRSNGESGVHIACRLKMLP